MTDTLTQRLDGIQSANPTEPTDRIRRHFDIAKACAEVLLGANLVAGAEIAILADRNKRRAGRPAAGEKQEITRPWREIVAERTGRGHEYCRLAEKAARDILVKLKGKRGDQGKIREMLLDPDRYQWTPDDYAAVGTVVGMHYDAVTWTDLLREMGILRKPVERKPGQGNGTGDPPRRLSLTEQAQITARAYLTRLRKFRVDDDTRRKRLLALEVATGDPDNPGLQEILTELEDRAAEVRDAIQAKSN